MRLPTTSTLGVLLLTSIAAGCRSHETRTDPARGGADLEAVQQADSVSKLPRCPSGAPVDTLGWVPATAGEHVFPGSLPPGFRADTTVRFRHGGASWTDGARTFSIGYGYWSLRSFPPESIWCRVVIGGEEGVLIGFPAASRDELALWFPDRAVGTDRVYQPLYTFTGALDGGTDLFLAIVEGSRAARR